MLLTLHLSSVESEWTADRLQEKNAHELTFVRPTICVRIGIYTRTLKTTVVKEYLGVWFR